jgi:hypothetical protein
MLFPCMFPAIEVPGNQITEHARRGDLGQRGEQIARHQRRVADELPKLLHEIDLEALDFLGGLDDIVEESDPCLEVGLLLHVLHHLEAL